MLDSLPRANYPDSAMLVKIPVKRRVIALFAAACAAGAVPASAESVTLFRVFLNDGTAIVSYGEYARVGDRLVFSMPIGAVDPGSSSTPVLHVVNLPLSAVNWPATAQYADSARFAHYMKTKAESDYAALAGDVAATLNAIVVAKDPKTRLEMAVSARRRLATWPRDHYGYRADDVREMLGLLDEAISGLRAAAGETSFSLDLVATSAPVAREPRRSPQLLAAPSPAEAIAQALTVAKTTDVPADRISILRGVVAALDDPRNALPSRWAGEARKSALRNLKEEARVGQEYASLMTSALKRAGEAAQRADVRRIETVLTSATRRDRQLGRRRPDEVKALVDQLQLQLASAQRLRLARDQWQERRGAHRAYSRVIAPIIEDLVRAQRNLDDIKSLAGSEASVLVTLGDRLATASKTLAVVPVPDDLKPAHALLTSAVNLASTAVRTRRQATVTGQLALAWEASSAAAGSMMLFGRAKEDMEAAVRLPQLR